MATSSYEWELNILVKTINNKQTVFSRTIGLILTKLDTKQHWVKGFQVCTNEGPYPLQVGRWNLNKFATFNHLFIQNYIINFNQTWNKASFGWQRFMLVQRKDHSSLKRLIMIHWFFFKYNHSFSLACWTGFQVSNVAHGPLVEFLRGNRDRYRCW